MASLLRPTLLPRLTTAVAAGRKPSTILSSAAPLSAAVQSRSLHITIPPPPVPQPVPGCEDVPTILQKIGRNTIQHADKFPTWDSFFLTTSEQMRELGIEPARDRRYILNWRQKLRTILKEGEAGVAKIVEKKRGVKKNGGERRRAEVLFKKRVEERRAQKTE